MCSSNKEAVRGGKFGFVAFSDKRRAHSQYFLAFFSAFQHIFFLFVSFFRAHSIFLIFFFGLRFWYSENGKHNTWMESSLEDWWYERTRVESSWIEQPKKNRSEWRWNFIGGNRKITRLSVCWHLNLNMMWLCRWIFSLHIVASMMIVSVREVRTEKN